MAKVRSRQWFMLILTGILFLSAFLLGRGEEQLPGKTPGALAASSEGARSRVDCASGHYGPSFGAAVVVDTNEVVCDNLTEFGGTVAINGRVKGELVTFNSDVVIAGTIDGDVNLYGGKLVLQSGSHVHGDIHLYGGHWTRHENAQIDGAVIDRTANLDWLLPGNSGFSFPFWSILIWVAVGMLLTTLLPEHVMLVRTTVMNKTRRSMVIGLLSILLAPPVLVVLIALVLSIPLAIIVAIGLIVAWALGTVAVGWLVGENIMRRVAPQQNTRLMQIVVGLTVLVLAGSLPYIGWLISIGAGLLGLGAVFLSRFGTRLYSQPKMPLTL